MSKEKKRIRALFRTAVLFRDGWICRKCGSADGLDAHHVTDRREMANGGCVPENGISLCAACHRKAEAFHETGKASQGFSPEELYDLTGSSEAMARKADEEWTPRG